MVKAKRRQVVALAVNKDNALNRPADSLNSGAKGDDIHDEDDWVIVKKQKITILIPPPLVPVQLTVQGPRKMQIPMKSRKTTESQQVVPSERCLWKCSADEQKKTVAVPSKEKVQINERTCPPAISPAEELPDPTFRTALEGLNRLVGKSSSQPPSLDFVHGQHLHGTCGSSKGIMMSGVTQNVKNPTIPQSSYHQGSTLLFRPVGCLNISLLKNKKLQASNLERKLKMAGGLSKWLVSLGLGQFVQMFQRTNMDKFQLLSLTMSKLKEMGADAVGPRRKLIHAIDCLSQPYCFKTF